MKGFAAFSIAIGAIWTAWFLVAPRVFQPQTPGALPGLTGSGDMFGSLSALSSGLAFARLISTLLMQRKELALQREELELTRIEFRS